MLTSTNGRVLDHIYFALLVVFLIRSYAAVYLNKKARPLWAHDFAGDYTLGVTPHPIPNCEVKP